MAAAMLAEACGGTAEARTRGSVDGGDAPGRGGSMGEQLVEPGRLVVRAVETGVDGGGISFGLVCGLRLRRFGRLPDEAAMLELGACAVAFLPGAGRGGGPLLVAGVGGFGLVVAGGGLGGLLPGVASARAVSRSWRETSGAPLA
jgi:hypothetical protein